jgi:polysaccharide pyruvyl transferase WcaK-like protein
VKQNVHHLTELFDFAVSQGLYIKFRIGEFIEHLHNGNLGGAIRNFDHRERHAIYLHFDMLERRYERDPKVRESYRNVIRMIRDGGSRVSGCTAHKNSVHLSHDGRLAACAPKGHDVATVSETTTAIASKIRQERNRLVSTKCGSCVHDYHSYPGIFRFGARRASFWFWRIRLCLPVALFWPRMFTAFAKNRAELPGGSHVVLGWYGTETNGDKAILDTVIRDVRSRARPGERIVLFSTEVRLTQWTLHELGVSDVDVVDVYGSSFFAEIASARSITIGGGPLMHIDPLGYLLEAFECGRKTGARLRVFGCGVGPLDRGARYRWAVRRILSLADEVTLRDRQSLVWARDHGCRGVEEMRVTDDPSMDFVRQWLRGGQHPVNDSGEYVACFLRDLPREYFYALDDDSFSALREAFERNIVKHLSSFGSQGLRVKLLPMHSYHIGGDDRLFNARLARRGDWSVPPSVETRPISPQEALLEMKNAKRVVCMRFHSVVFASLVNPNFEVIDYTRGGKIASFIKDRSLKVPFYSVEDIANGIPGHHSA